ncbi:MAG: hypothetical protein KJ949_00050 [Nanoarchaeota archaeon]|nr:hypothetical protein [Nanoarchaeota archaeon]
MKNKILLIILGMFLINFVFAVPEIPTIYINTQTPSLNQSVLICADVNDTETISLVRLYLNRESPEWNWGLVMDLEEENFYCEILSPETMRVNEITDDYKIDFYLTAKNSLGETFTSSTYSFIYTNSSEETEEEEDEIPIEEDSNINIKNPKMTFVQYCEPNWKCSLWNNCFNGMKTRKCYDTNGCKVSYNKPLEITSCEIDYVPEQEKVSWLFVLSGLIILALLGWILVLLLGKRKIT